MKKNKASGRRFWTGVASVILGVMAMGSEPAAWGQNAADGVVATNATARTPWLEQLQDLRLGPFDLHPRLVAGLAYDDNIILGTTNKEADVIWSAAPGFQAVAGDDAALIAYRDQHYDILSLAPDNIIVQDRQRGRGSCSFWIIALTSNCTTGMARIISLAKRRR